ncbi:cytidine deaminase [Azospirillum sp. TSH7]|jgi:cytidine deaminase|uniref:cytidine deaminase n=1 Tax=unclassified Azospirillum TaxID=2630922 RepID=UPI000D61C2E2|nr:MULTISPECIES: cytidine deaminase [unclassified Azospirillum]PWC66097.1 cytidine deaminase [Azospirillum sp. TSH7]PWC72422.1 cytidine deaminase [Azospirillum sp. TSH20]
MTDPAELSRMIEAARAARENAHAPYSKFKVGAAILGESGRIFAGCNVENAAYPQGQCAESSAIGAMVTAGDRRIRAIVVMGGEAGAEEICTPCGGCRQRIREFATPETPIHICDPAGLRRTFSLEILLPESFGPTNLAF